MLVALASAAGAADAPATKAAPSKEMREKRAVLHEQMAACLRSDKPFAECRKQMMKGGEDMMGKDNCPMMMGMGSGMMHMGQRLHGRATPPADSADPQ